VRGGKELAESSLKGEKYYFLDSKRQNVRILFEKIYQYDE
jgi:hypothetical protein